MKKFIIFAVLFISCFTFFSCQKEESSKRIDPTAIRSQLVGIPAPSKEEIMVVISGSPLKSGTDLNSVMLIQVFQLTPWTFDVNNSYAVKHFVLYGINQNGYREKYFTINQRFEIRDGNIDMTQYILSFDIGCPYAKYFLLKNQNNIIQINYFFRFSDGRQFAYFGENNSGSVKLTPIDGGQWQIEVVYDDGDLQQRFNTKMIDMNGDTMLDLDIKLEDENVVSFVEMESILTKGTYSIQFLINDQNGEYMYMNCPIMYNENVQGYIYFSVPFDPEFIVICGVNGCREYLTKDMSFGFRDGKRVYRLQ